jgi:MFS family permease
MSTNARAAAGAEAQPEHPADGSGAKLVLLALAAGQFLMTLDSSVMNVSMATVAADLDTTITGIQSAITLYTLVMASLMIVGSKLGALLGSLQAFRLGLIIYGIGAFTTAIAPNLSILLFGCSLAARCWKASARR